MTQEEFTHIASEMRRNAVSVAQRYGFAPDDAEDIAQEVMLNLSPVTKFVPTLWQD